MHRNHMENYNRSMLEQRSRLQLLVELRRLDQEHTGAPPDPAFDELLERYSYGELQVIVDFLAADTDRLRNHPGGSPRRR